MDYVSESVFEEILVSVLDERFPEIESLTEHQRKALLTVINRKEVFAILPTGHGKSITFQLLPDVCKYLCLSGYSYSYHAIILVVCPLKSLVDSHIRELRNRGISAASLSGEDVDSCWLPSKSDKSVSQNILFGAKFSLSDFSLE